ncbi:MAG: hypothetical protein H0V80_10350 [Acidobacteria bacterium]|nr:hypothetical protein [Acidobacteriota bacterium]
MSSLLAVPNALVRLMVVLVLTGSPSAGAPLCAARPGDVDDRYLESCRPREVTAAERRLVIASLPQHGEVTDLTPAERQKLLGIRRVLQAHARDGIYDIRVVDVATARTALYARVVVLISRPALELLAAEELQGVIAHEVGHEYVWDEWESATRQGDSDKLKDLELICDAVGALTLARIGVPPERLILGQPTALSSTRQASTGAAFSCSSR